MTRMRYFRTPPAAEGPPISVIRTQENGIGEYHRVKPPTGSWTPGVGYMAYWMTDAVSDVDEITEVEARQLVTAAGATW